MSYPTGPNRPPLIPDWLKWFLATFLGAPATLLGAGWIYTFGFTDYRAHYRLIGLPLGIVTFALGLLLLLPTFPKIFSSRRPRP